MGVKDLWQLLAPIGRRVSIETLEGKTLAIDVSIWIIQFIKAMRDEDGKMVKNAHIIGTMKRILKLLFHRIRPVFVFDGSTPALKQRTMKARRKSQDDAEVSRRVAAQKILLSKLKQQAIKESLGTSPTTNAGKFSNNFNPLSSPQTNINDKTQTEENEIGEINNNTNKHNVNSSINQIIDEANETEEISDEKIEWLDGYSNLKQKKLDDDADDDFFFNNRNKNNNSNNEFAYFIPENFAEELNVDVLSSLPPHVRKNIIEEARKKERMRSRNNYLPLASDPFLYSQIQLTNFLNSRKLNNKIDEVQKNIDKKEKKNGVQIAAEGNKKYLLLKKNDKNFDVDDAMNFENDCFSELKNNNDIINNNNNNSKIINNNVESGGGFFFFFFFFFFVFFFY
jgi:DNA excision repair protein ERCC-5